MTVSRESVNSEKHWEMHCLHFARPTLITCVCPTCRVSSVTSRPLEKRLAESIAAGFSGELKISFYRDGLRMVFVRGRLKTVEAWKSKKTDDESAAFPDLTFLQLLFGYRSLNELCFAFKDCYWSNNTVRVMLNALFPKRLSDVFPVFVIQSAENSDW